MKRKSSDYDKVAHLIPLRVTGDLSVDEAKTVDETARYDDKSRDELESFSHALSVLQEAASAPLPGESAVVRGESSLWDRLEPRLGPAGRRSARGLDWFSTRSLAAACLALVALTLATEGGRLVRVEQAVNPVAIPPSGAVQGISNNLIGAAVPPHHIGESVLIPQLGVVVTRIERLMQKSLRLPDLNGVVVTVVVPNSIADHAGLKPGDCVVGIDGKAVYAPRHTVEVLRETLADREAHFDLIRGGQQSSATIRLAAKAAKNETGERMILPPLELDQQPPMESNLLQLLSVAG